MQSDIYPYKVIANELYGISKRNICKNCNRQEN